ncbi:hypothetical protein QUB13_14610 [Microcoleus sp. B4-D4]
MVTIEPDSLSIPLNLLGSECGKIPGESELILLRYPEFNGN